ncbi:MAG: isochorismatase family protein [Opitutae bacterium]|nr:isochorismatase family protein [Opitutae bacterium]
MSSPLTLRQISGALDRPAALADSVVIVIDAQKEYTEGILPLVGIDDSVAALAAFLARAREARVPIIHVVQIGKPGGRICAPGGRFVEVIDAVKPLPGEVIVEKRFPNSFTETTLERELVRLGRKNLVLVGYMAHMCVNSTTRAAAEAGYHCTVVAELTATRDLPDGRGGVIPAAVVKAANLAALRDRFAVVVETAAEIP